MSKSPILVVGAGPAGLRASIELARAGQQVVLVDQAPGIGGAVYAGVRNPASDAPTSTEAQTLIAGLAEQADRIDLRCRTAFAGIDYTGAVLLTGEGGELMKPRALVLATGARELVRPRPGWTDPRVTTAGAVQVSLKTGGEMPKGRIVLAGNGPLLFAIGAQLVQAGNPPQAILTEGRPFAHPLAALLLPAKVIREAVGYMIALRRAGVSILAGTRLIEVADRGDALMLVTSKTGRQHQIIADHLALHDGLARNDYGLPAKAAIPVVQAGDCREVLGRLAAERDGVLAAREILAQLGLSRSPDERNVLARYRLAQKKLAVLFAPVLGDVEPPPDETILCRCEGRTMKDLRAVIGAHGTPRQVRLNARFGMGPCQGRFCLDWVSKFAGPSFELDALRGRHWPIRPVSIADIVNAPDRRPDIHRTEAETLK